MGKPVTSPTRPSPGSQPQTPSAVEPPPPKYKKVFIQRDYTQGTGVKYQSTFPPELEGYIDPESFAYLINNINQIYDEGETMSSRAFCESCCACLSAYIIYLCMESFYDKCARKVSSFVDEQNDMRWKPRGLLVTDPLERGLRVIEITIFLEKAEQRQAQHAAAVAAATHQAQAPAQTTRKTTRQSSVISAHGHESHTSAKTK